MSPESVVMVRPGPRFANASVDPSHMRVALQEPTRCCWRPRQMLQTARGEDVPVFEVTAFVTAFESYCLDRLRGERS
jgi:hypothetical protein